jgi:hypothetical protein
VEEPPDEDRRRNDEQAEGLVAAEKAALVGAALVFGQLLQVWLDTAFDHACALFGGCDGRAGSPRISIGADAMRALRLHSGELIEEVFVPNEEVRRTRASRPFGKHRKLEI